MSGKAIIIIVVGIVVVSGIVLYNIEAGSIAITRNVDRFYSGKAAQNIAQSGVNMALRQLANDKDWRTGFPSIDMLGGKGFVHVSDSTWYGKKVIKIVSVGILNQGQPFEVRDTSTAYLPRGGVPGAIRGLITTNSPTSLEGDPLVDARDHTALGALVSNNGTLAVWTTKTLSPAGDPMMGGTVLGVDYVPSDPYLPIVVQSGQSFPNYPLTPDSVLGATAEGYPEGTLKAIAQSGNGNQYVTDPSTLTYPLTGVTYVELPSGGSFKNTNITGSGILIVHNGAKNALLEDCNLYFTGLVLVDDCLKKSDISHTGTPVLLGAVFGMSPDGNKGRWGNSDGSYVYSSEAIENAMKTATIASGRSLASSVLGWWE
ncbi:MAG TPA: hypothetical protein VES59_03865 [Bacteroidota bacterium]|nr:hypothetical protein [Bacteroidota bacterium]